MSEPPSAIALDPATPGWSGTTPWGTARFTPAELAEAPELLVVGAGHLGLWVAHEAVRRGYEHVQVVDRVGPAAGASGRNAGALLADVHARVNDPALAALQRRGLELHRRSADELGYPLDRLRWLVHDPAAPPGADDELPAEARGRVRLPGRITVVDDQAVTDPIAVATALGRELEIVPGVAVHEVVPGGPPVVRTSAGTCRPRQVVLAVGGDPTGGSSRFVTGHLAVTPRLEPPLPVGVSTEIVIVPRPDGRLCVGGTKDGEHRAGRVDAAVVARIGDVLGQVVPELAGCRFEEVWTGQRPVTADLLPLVDELGPGVVVAGGLYHTGVLTSPAVAECVATFLVEGRWPALAHAFHRGTRELASTTSAE